MVEKYIPKRGDLVWLEFNPQLGHEQKGRRPALIISPLIYNEKTKLCLLYPVTSKIKGYPFEEPILGKNIKGVVLTDQIKSFDWSQRNPEYIESVSEKILQKCLEKSDLLLDIK